MGSEQFKIEYVSEKIEKWIDQLRMLEKVAKVEPHLAYCSYVFGLQHRYTYLLRTIPNIGNDLKRLDEAIDQYLIKHLFHNHSVTDIERIWLSLPPRLGGLGINVPSEVADTFYKNSRLMTAELVDRIIYQHDSEHELPPEEKPARVAIAEDKKKREEDKVNQVKQELDPQKLKLYDAIRPFGKKMRY